MRRRQSGPPFVMIDRALLQSKEWKELSVSQMITYIYIKKNYNGGNNGEIPLAYSELRSVFAPATLSKSLKDLINKGWIEKTKHGGMYRYQCLYKLTGKHDRIR